MLIFLIHQQEMLSYKGVNEKWFWGIDVTNMLICTCVYMCVWRVWQDIHTDMYLLVKYAFT